MYILGLGKMGWGIITSCRLRFLALRGAGFGVGSGGGRGNMEVGGWTNVLMLHCGSSLAISKPLLMLRCGSSLAISCTFLMLH